MTTFKIRLMLSIWLNCWVFAGYCSDKVDIVTENWPPHIYLNKAGNIDGDMTKRIEAIMNQAQIEYSIGLYPWPRAYKIAQTDKNVLIYPLFKQTERLNKFHFICPFTQKIQLFLFKLEKRNDIRLTTLEDAKRFTIGLVRDDHDHLMLLQLGFVDGVQLDPNVDDISSLKKLLKGRIDLMVQSKNSMKQLIQRSQFVNTPVVEAFAIPLNRSGENCIAMSLGSDPLLLKKIEQALNYVNQHQGLLILD